ncbi:MAG: gamma-carboxymuconolactone decarboxylase [Pseudomonadota bacterium]|nr:gamma-carboxymuconolactone decarboxylase [Pseudomonadota bacterium]
MQTSTKPMPMARACDHGDPPDQAMRQQADGLRAHGLDRLHAIDPHWAAAWQALATRSAGASLAPKLAALIRLNIDVTATHLHAPGVQRHVQACLDAGATRAEIMAVFKLAAVIGIHALALGVPMLEAELKARGLPDDAAPQPATPVTDAVRARGQFNPLWETLARWDPAWLERFLAMGLPLWTDGVLPPLWIELLCISGDAAITHLYAHGTQRHIEAALAMGATREQILDVLKIVSLQGIQSMALALPFLDAATAPHPSPA